MQEEEWLQRRRFVFVIMCIVWLATVYMREIMLSNPIKNIETIPVVATQNDVEKSVGSLSTAIEVGKDVFTFFKCRVTIYAIGKVNYPTFPLLGREFNVKEKNSSIKKEKKDVVETTTKINVVGQKNNEVVQSVAIQVEIPEQKVENVVQGNERGTFFLERAEAIPYTDEDLYYLANGIYSEAGICSDMECYRVGQVMLNRYLDVTGRFPQNTIKGVLYAPGQFGCVNGSAWRHGPNQRELQIAKDLLEGARVFPQDVVWFNNTHDYGYLYCRPEYHYFSGYLYNGGNYAGRVKSAMISTEEMLELAMANTVEENVQEPEANEVPEQTEESDESLDDSEHIQDEEPEQPEEE